MGSMTSCLCGGDAPDAKPAASGKKYMPQLPLDIYSMIAVRLDSLQGLQNLTSTCKSLHSLRSRPEVRAACRERRTQLARDVHDCNVALRSLLDNHCKWKLQEAVDMGWICFSKGPRPSMSMFLETAPAFALAQLHRGILARPRLVGLLGHRRSEVFTLKDQEAERVYRAAGAGTFDIYLDRAGVFATTTSPAPSKKRGSQAPAVATSASWVCAAVDALERIVTSLCERGMPLDSIVPRGPLKSWDPEDFEQLDMRDPEVVTTLRHWFKAQEGSLGRAITEVLISLYC